MYGECFRGSYMFHKNHAKTPLKNMLKPYHGHVVVHKSYENLHGHVLQDPCSTEGGNVGRSANESNSSELD
jgi:hypothetical protein